jgi:hypothetical protein
VFADVYNADDKPINCLQASVTFGYKSVDGVEMIEEVGDL